MRFKAAVTVVAVVLVGLTGCSSNASTPVAKKADFCTLVIAFKAANDTLGNDVTGGDPAKARAAMKQILGQVQTLQKKAPADVKTDVDTAAGFITAFDALLAKNNYDVAAIEANATTAAEFQALTTDEVNAALARLGSYSTTECGVASSVPTANS